MYPYPISSYNYTYCMKDSPRLGIKNSKERERDVGPGCWLVLNYRLAAPASQQIGIGGPAWPGEAQLRNNDCVQPALACLPACLAAAVSWPGTKSSPNTFPVSLSAPTPLPPFPNSWPGCWRKGGGCHPSSLRMKTPSRSGLQVGMGPLQRFTGDNCLVWRPSQAF